jgi:hypothetical protein
MEGHRYCHAIIVVLHRSYHTYSRRRDLKGDNRGVVDEIDKNTQIEILKQSVGDVVLALFVTRIHWMQATRH